MVTDTTLSTDAQYAVVADIGGTNARFGRINLNTFALDRIQVFPCADYLNLTDAMIAYREQQQVELVHVAIAIACPAENDAIQMTNHHWQFSVRGTRDALKLQTFIVLNDFAASAMSLVTLQDKELTRVGGGPVIESAPRVVLGAGTGLGVGHLVQLPNGDVMPLPGEGGHADWAPINDVEWAIHESLARRFDGRVSAERVLSGPGLENLYQAIAEYHDCPALPLRAATIGARALSGCDAIATQAVHQFFASLGSFAGNLALNLNTRGGVYIAGGVVPKLLPLMAASEFRSRFEHKGRFCNLAETIPCFVITADHAGMRGVAQYLKQTLKKD
ncbi:MAG: glucokinase [Pseudomonadota bacterium]